VQIRRIRLKGKENFQTSKTCPLIPTEVSSGDGQNSISVQNDKKNWSEKSRI